MARRRSSADYEKKAADAKARENYYRTRPARPKAGNTLTAKDATTLIYRSLFLIFTTVPGDDTSKDHLPFKVEAGNKALAKVPANTVGLSGINATGINISLARPIRGSGIKPSKINWYNGAANPTIRTTAYGTKWAQYYDNAEGEAQSNFSLPVCRAAGSFGIADIVTSFKTIFSDANKTGLLGAKNGRAELDLEYAASFLSVTT